MQGGHISTSLPVPWKRSTSCTCRYHVMQSLNKRESTTIIRQKHWGRRLEGWPNTAARLAGWRRVTQQAVRFCVMDSPCHLPWRTAPLALVWGWSITKCTQNTVSKEGMAWYSSRPMPSLWSEHSCDGLYTGEHVPIFCTRYWKSVRWKLCYMRTPSHFIIPKIYFLRFIFNGNSIWILWRKVIYWSILCMRCKDSSFNQMSAESA